MKDCLLYCWAIFFSLLLISPLAALCAQGESPKGEVQNNLVINPGMEQGEQGVPEGWKTKIKTLSPQFTWDSKEAHSGRRSLKIQGPGAGYWYTDTVPVRPGKKYRISFYCKTKSEKEYNPDANLYAIVWRVDAKKILHPVQWVNDYKMKTYQDWTKINVVDYIAQEGDKAILLQLWLNGNRRVVSPTDRSSVWYDDVSIEEIDCPPVKDLNFLIHQDNNFSIWSANALSSVYRSEAVPTASLKDSQIFLCGARGEQEAFQLVIRPEKTWDKVTWEWEDFRGPSALVKNKMRYYRVEYISLREPNNEVKEYMRGGMVPDPIPSEPVSRLLEKQNNPFFFVIKIPYQVKAGIYTTRVRLKNHGKIVATVPVELRIRNFAIPKEPTFEMMSALWSGLIYRYESGNKNEILKRYLKNLAEHRAITDAGNFKFKIVLDKNRTKHISVDTTDLADIIAYEKQLGWDKNLYLHWLNFKINSAFGVPVFLDNMNKEFNPEFVRLFKELLGQLNDCLEKQGCYSSFGVQIADEPGTLEKGINFFTNVPRLFKTIDPRIRTYSNGIFQADFLPYYDHWNFIHLFTPFSQPEINLMRKHKKSVGIYLNNMVSPALPPLKMRLLLWALWKEHYQGMIWWQINGWGHGVFQRNAKGKIISVSFQKDNPWTGKMGGVVFIYPPREGKNETGPINSLRWEALRKGLEDLEYFNMLARLLKEKNGKISEDQRLKAKEALARINEVVSHVPCSGRMDIDQFNTYDMALVEAVRAQVAESIEDLRHSH